MEHRRQGRAGHTDPDATCRDAVVRLSFSPPAAECQIIDGRQPMPNWAEQVTAIGTAVGAIGLLSAIGAVIFAGRQAREARIGREAATAVEFFRRWNEAPLVEARRLIAQFQTAESLRDAMVRFIGENSVQAFVLYRELDYFEQLGALEKHGGFDFELIKTLLGRRLIDRWEMWEPTIEAIGGKDVYPMFGRLVSKMRAAQPDSAAD